MINRYADISQSLAVTEPASFCEEICEAGTQELLHTSTEDKIISLSGLYTCWSIILPGHLYLCAPFYSFNQSEVVLRSQSLL